jgi:hypothetical protein
VELSAVQKDALVTTSAAVPRRWHSASRLGVAALALVLWLRLLTFPFAITTTLLDDSWALALAHFTATGARAGVDYVFTYGPLGSFLVPAHEPSLYWQRYAWELVVKLALAVAILLALAALPSRGLRFLGVAFVLAFATFFPDSPYLIGLLAMGSLLVDGAARGRAWVLLLIPLLALFSLEKHTFLVIALCVVGCGELAARLRGYRGLLSPAPLYIVALVLVWLAAGQRLADMPTYLATAWQIVAGYGEAMSYPGPAWVVGLLAATTILIWLLIIVSFRRQRPGPFHLSAGLLFAAIAFLLWKHGVTRNDWQHAGAAFIETTFLALLLSQVLPVVLAASTRLAYAVLLLLGLSGSIIGTYEDRPQLISHALLDARANLTALFRPVEHERQLDESTDEMRRNWHLPTACAEIGNGSVDLLASDQAVILLNNLDYRPRPAFQSYSAYTASLLRANADHFRAADAPDFVLCRLSPVDDRLAASEDSLALLELLRRYSPVGKERGYAILKRVPPGDEGPEPTGEVALRRSIRFGEEIKLSELPGDFQLLTLNLSPSALGMAKGALYRREMIVLRLRTASEKTYLHRLIPAMASEGFLINPLVRSTADFVRLYGPAPADRVVSFAVMPSDATDYRDEIGVVVTALPRLPCRNLSADEAERLASR